MMFKHGSIQALSLVALLFSSLYGWADEFDVAINNGRVIDPVSGLDAVRHLGIVNGKIAAVSERPLAGHRVIDAENLIVAPGFIDLHSHAMTPAGQEYQLFDGVTTALELEAGAYPANRVKDSLVSAPLIHFGASVGYLWLRQWYLSRHYQASLVHQPEASVGRDTAWASYPPRSVFTQILRQEQIDDLVTLLEQAFSEGFGIGLGVPIDYLKQGISEAELHAVFSVAAAYDQVVFIHARRLPVGDLGGLDEVIELAQDTGASVHFCHINSNALTAIGPFLQRVSQAQTNGVDISIEAYPYEAGSTQIGAAAFRGDWQTLYGMTPNDIVWVKTGERLTAQTFHDYQTQDPNGYIVLFSNTMAAVDLAVLNDQTIVASDAMPDVAADAKVHPRGRGTFTRSLHRYVIEQKKLTWSQAIAKMTSEPALRLQSMAPAFARKGRLTQGSDADVVVFDPSLVQDQATYENPDQRSLGMRFVLVNGQLVVDHGTLVPNASPGLFIQSSAPNT
jgi:dihydroorotase-like cyclic amidohydrolase